MKEDKSPRILIYGVCGEEVRRKEQSVAFFKRAQSEIYKFGLEGEPTLSGFDSWAILSHDAAKWEAAFWSN